MIFQIHSQTPCFNSQVMINEEKFQAQFFLYNLISKHEDKWWGRVEKPDK